MSSYQLMTMRIRKQCRQIQQKPLDNILVSIKSEREIHFCIYGLDGVYKDGFYHGILQLPENYPFSAPKFKFFTGSGRFEVGKYVCTTFTSYHQQAWSSAWTIRTILTAILSFFQSQQTGYGSMQQTDSKRMKYALVSLDRNLQREEFVELFEQKLKEKGVDHPKMHKLHQSSAQVNMKEMNAMVNDQITIQENIESVMLPEANNVLQRRDLNSAKCIIRMLYAVLIVILVAVVLMM